MDASATIGHRIAIPAARSILRTFVGWSAGLFLAIALVVDVAAAGVLAAALQRHLLLRSQAFAGTSWWLVITPIGWLLAGRPAG